MTLTERVHLSGDELYDILLYYDLGFGHNYTSWLDQQIGEGWRL